MATPSKLPYVTVETQCPTHGVMRRSLSPEGAARLPKGCPTCAKGSGPKEVARAMHPSKWEKFASATQVPVGQGWRTRGEKKPPTLPPAGKPSPAPTRPGPAEKIPGALGPASEKAPALDYPKCATEGCLREAWQKGLCSRCLQRATYRKRHPDSGIKPCATPGCKRRARGNDRCCKCRAKESTRARYKAYMERQRARGLA